MAFFKGYFKMMYRLLNMHIRMPIIITVVVFSMTLILVGAPLPMA